VKRFGREHSHALALSRALLLAAELFELQRHHGDGSRRESRCAHCRWGNGLRRVVRRGTLVGGGACLSAAKLQMKTDIALTFVLIVCLGGAIGLSRGLDQHRINSSDSFAEEPLYLNGRSAKRMTLAFNGLVADWYWMRSLQYMGRKIVTYEDEHNGKF